MKKLYFGVINFFKKIAILMGLIKKIKETPKKKKTSANGEKGKFSVFVINKVVLLLQLWIDFYMAFPVEQLKLCISKGNKKIGKALNISLAPIITCINCKQCMYFCYDIKACLAYPSALLARARNTAIFLLDRNYYFNQLHETMKRRKSEKYLRFHVSGEIVDLDHFCRMVETAKLFPDWTIWTYTKNYSIVNYYCYLYGKESIPENFTVMFSEWKGLKMDNPNNFPVFDCVENESMIKGYKCPGCCDTCKRNGKGCVNGKSATVVLH